MQNGSSVGTYTHCIHVFACLAPICMLSRCLSLKISASELSRIFIKSALLVGYYYVVGPRREREREIDVETSLSMRCTEREKRERAFLMVLKLREQESTCVTFVMLLSFFITWQQQQQQQQKQEEEREDRPQAPGPRPQAPGRGEGGRANTGSPSISGSFKVKKEIDFSPFLFETWNVTKLASQNRLKSSKGLGPSASLPNLSLVWPPPKGNRPTTTAFTR